MDFTRDELTALHRRSTAVGTTLVLCDLAGYLLSLAMIAYATWWVPRLVFATTGFLFVSRLFVLGHDACHQSLTPSRKLNRALGIAAFLPSLHVFSLWDLGHNRIHHRWTNQRGLDYVWEPLEPSEYARLSAFQRWKYRLYRSTIGHTFYYPAEIWWKKMFFPRPSAVGGYQRDYVLDHIPVLLWMAICPAFLIALRYAFAGDPGWVDLAMTLLWGWIVPMAAFELAFSSVVYLHHTHPSVSWTRNALPADEQLAGSVHILLPGFVERTMHHIMDHTAHHARPGIPSYNLSVGQQMLEERHESIIVQKWTLGFHLDTIRKCKLFDLRAKRWVPFREAVAASRALAEEK